MSVSKANKRNQMPAPKTADLTLKNIHQSGHNKGQSRDYTHTFRIGGHTLRVTVHHDTSYQEQSRAGVEVWTPAGWTQVIHLLSHEVRTTDVPYGSPVTPAVFAEIEKVLMTAALAVLTA